MKLSILLPIIVVVIVGGMIVLALTSGYLGQDRPIEEAMENLFSADSFAVNMNLGLSGAAFNEQAIDSLELILDFAVDKKEEDNIKTQGAIDLVVRENRENMAATSSKAESEESRFSFELAYINKLLYLKVLSLGFIDALSGLSPELTEMLIGQWIEIDIDQIKALLGAAPEEEEAGPDTSAIINDFKKLVEGKKFFLIKEESEEEGMKVYLAELDKEAVKKFIPEFLAMMQKYVPAEQKTQYQENMEQALAEFEANLDQAWAEAGGVEFTAFIEGKWLRRLAYQKAAPEMNTNLTVDFADFNQDFSLAAPADALTLEDLLMSQFNLDDLVLPETLEAPESIEDFGGFELPEE